MLCKFIIGVIIGIYIGIIIVINIATDEEKK